MESFTDHPTGQRRKLSSSAFTWMAMLGLGALLTWLFFQALLVPLLPFAIACFVAYFTRSHRALLSTRTMEIQDLKEQQVRLEGTVTSLDSCAAPFSKQPCVGYHYTKEKIEMNSEGDESITKLLKHTHCADFILNTDSGAITVRAADARLDLLPKQVTDVLDLRHTEHLLLPSAHLVVVGYHRRNYYNKFELGAKKGSLLVITTPERGARIQEGFKLVLRTLPFFLLMYLLVNYFVFFAPIVKMPISTGLTLFFFFGVPIIAIVLAIGAKDRYSFSGELAGVCFVIFLLSFPLLILLYTINSDFFRIICIWCTIAISVSLNAIFNYKSLITFFRDEP